MRVGRFLVRRGFKIYPAFYVFLIVTVLLRMERGTIFSPAELLSEAFFVQNYGPHVWSHTWSLAVEEHFYLLLAALFWILQTAAPGRPSRWLLSVCVAAAVVIPAPRALTIWAAPYKAETHAFPTHLRIDELFFGVFLSFLYHCQPARVQFVPRRRALVFAGSAAVLVGSFLIPHPATRYVLAPTLHCVAFGGILLAALSVQVPTAGVVGRLSAGVAYLGSHSYSVYLWHTAVLVFGMMIARKILGGEPNYYVAFAGYIGASLAFGVVMSKLVEAPILRLRDRLFPSPGARPGRAEPAGGRGSAGPVMEMAPLR
jgi:peptidoglycan/LPS O-acetylase OafA/YrhL